MKRLWNEERGQNVSEYTLVLVLVGLLGASVASAFGVTIHSTYSTVCTSITHQSPSGATASDSASSSSIRSDSGSSPGNGSGNGNGHGKSLARGRQ